MTVPASKLAIQAARQRAQATHAKLRKYAMPNMHAEEMSPLEFATDQLRVQYIQTQAMKAQFEQIMKSLNETIEGLRKELAEMKAKYEPPEPEKPAEPEVKSETEAKPDAPKLKAVDKAEPTAKVDAPKESAKL